MIGRLLCAVGLHRLLTEEHATASEPSVFGPWHYGIAQTICGRGCGLYYPLTVLEIAAGPEKIVMLREAASAACVPRPVMMGTIDPDHVRRLLESIEL